MNIYDPLQAPDPTQWQSLDEHTRLDLVRAYHRQSGVQLPSELAHASIHVIVENQVALGDELPVRTTLERLQRDGLDRHEAIHAIGSVLAEHLQDVLREQPTRPGANNAYYERLKGLTAETWREEFGGKK